MKKFVSYITAITLATGLSFGLTATKAKAQEAQIGNTGVTLSAGYLGYHMHYSENVPTLTSNISGANYTQIGHDSEHGWMNGFYINLGYLSKKETPLGRFKTDLEFQYAHNSLSYNGSESTNLYQDPNDYRNTSQQYSSNDPATIFTVELKPGFVQDLSRNFSISEYAIFGYRHWIRDIEDTSCNTYVSGEVGGTPV